MNATMRFLVWGTMPLGGLAGGFMGEALGLRAAIAVGAAGSLLAFLWIWLSPVRSLSQIPAPAS
jgi:predicted MFS family arabinose efflux permease